jgi:hypothetical protein
MARGLQKLQSQQKNNEKKAGTKSVHDNKKTAAAGLLYSCVICKVNQNSQQLFSFVNFILIAVFIYLLPLS